LRINRKLLSIGARLGLHHTHKGAAETTGIRKTQARGDITDPLVRLREQMAGFVDPNFLKQLTVTGARAGKMSLQRAQTDTEFARCVRQSRITGPQ